MPSEKTILNCMPLGDLQAVARKLQVAVLDRRRKDALVTGLLKAKEHTLATVLAAMAAPALKAACADLELTPEGRGKAAWVEALVAAAPAKKPRAQKAAAAKKDAQPKASAPATRAMQGTKKAVVPKPAGAQAKPAQAKGVKAAAQSRAKAAAKADAQSPEVVQPQAAKSAEAAEAAAQPTPAEPVKKAPAAKRGPLSWSEAAQMAAHRGQSAQTMLRPPVVQASGTAQHTCTKCHAKVTVQACQVQACNNYYVAAPNRKICSECLFERNTISMDDFNDRLHEERLCTHCGVPMTHLASGGNA